MPSDDLRARIRYAMGRRATGDELLNLLGYGVTTGSIFYVDSVNGNDNNDGLASTQPNALATIDAAINKCTASKGDIIVAMPGHAETISAAAAIDFDVQGVTLLGLGYGTDRPAVTLDTATTTDIDIAAANVTIHNIHFINDIDALAAPFDVDAAHFTIEDCTMEDATAAKQTVRWILGDANADYLTVRNCHNIGSDTAGSTAWITLNGSAYPLIEGCRSNGDFSAANIEVVTAAITDGLITRNHLENANAVDVCIEGLASSTGWISHNLLRIATDAQVTGINTPGNMSLFENYQVNDNGETGILVGTASV